jgi:hypothetical protein
VRWRRRTNPKSRVRVVDTGSGPWARLLITGDRSDERIHVPPETTVAVQDANCRAVLFGGQQIDNWTAEDSLFSGCDFRRAIFTGGVACGHRPATYRDCDFRDADLRGLSPYVARFERCRFDGALLDDWDARCAEFVACTFSGKLRRVKFSAKPLGVLADIALGLRPVNEFNGNDFMRAELDDCTFTGGIDPRDQRFPESPDVVVLDELGSRLDAVEGVVGAPEADLAVQLRIHRTFLTSNGQEFLIAARKDVEPWFLELLEHATLSGSRNVRPDEVSE